MTFSTGEKRNSYFLVSVVITSIIISIPIISNHFLHPEHYFHIAVHEAGFVLAIFLFTMTIIAYNKTKIRRMLFAAGAFLTLSITQLGYMIEKINTPENMKIESVAEEHFDIGILIMTALFAFGIFYKK